MVLYTKESLDKLRNQVDLIELISSHVQMKRVGTAHKALCPFHEEKTPSFLVHSGDTHYHCFGCGAHGDAIAFLMNHLKMGFTEAVDSLAERFGVILEKIEGDKREKGPDKVKLKEILELASRFYQTLLLHTEEGHAALKYLYQRGIDLEFIRSFRIGYALSQKDLWHTFAKAEGISSELLLSAGLITEKGRDFFSERITFPITDPFGSVIGFSARKIKEETFGGKYINTPETPLFKKSHVLFGLSYSRQRIAKERRAIIVEGQIDALRLIHSGFNFTVAAQGTAFGEGHAKLLVDLGVNQVFLSMDGDLAGRQAAAKVGNLFQSQGIGVFVLNLPDKTDPDSLLRSQGIPFFQKLLETASDYLSFLFKFTAEGKNLTNPAQKNEVIQKLVEQIRTWTEPVMVHESLRKLAQLSSVPESVIGVGMPPTSFIKRFSSVDKQEVDPDRILETDLLRWLILCQEERLFEIVSLNVATDLFRNPICQKIFNAIMEARTRKEKCDLIFLGSVLEKGEEEKLLVEIVQKKINLQKAEVGLLEVIHRLLIRKWMHERESIKTKIQSGTCSDEEALQLAKIFDEIKKNQPVVVLP